MPNKTDSHNPLIPNGKMPDRPLECIDCKKPLAVYYTEVASAITNRTCHCADCPVLQRKLYGLPPTPGEGSLAEGRAGLACGNCGTTLDAVRVGSPLGCSECYEVFDDVMLPELGSMGKIPPRLVTGKRTQTIHIGRARGEMKEISASMRLLALNEALTETLKHEDYEQAARLRDQIKALTDAQSKEKKDGPQ